ncbi:helix-turn-helix domain-containing protein [Microbacterium schleiferi]|uniref:Helix-turn-helix transcriptional regulator n=1 Tax=Microbacterium schleiferi TaxID=69362 RepID=A0ABU7V952_9MICO
MVSGPAATPEWADYAKQLGINLRRARDAKGYTQEKMAELTGISLYAYQQYERGSVTRGGAPTNPRLATVLAICEALELSVDYLLPPPPALALGRSSSPQLG